MPPSTPSIRISHHNHRRGPSPTATRMAIPRARDPVPPPLPPPQYLPEISAGRDPGWQWGNDPSTFDFGRAASVKPGSSLLGASPVARPYEIEWDSAMEHTRRASSLSTVTPSSSSRDVEMADGGYAHVEEEGIPSGLGSSYRLQSEKRLEQTTLEGSSQAYDKQLLSRIGGPTTPRKQSASYPPGMQDSTAQTQTERRSSQLRLLSMPGSRHGSIDSTAGVRGPYNQQSSDAGSPAFVSAWDHAPAGDATRSQTHHASLNHDRRTSVTGSYDHSMFVHDDLPVEDGQMSSLRINDRSPSISDDCLNGLKAGTKRRASSPPRSLQTDERSAISNAAGAQGEFLLRRSTQQFPSRDSPVSRFHPSHSSLSSASSYGGPRHGSLGSSLGIASNPSSATGYTSGRVSPINLSPAIDPELKTAASYNGAKGLGPSPTQLSPRHQRNLSESTQPGAQKPSPETVSSHSRRESLEQAHGVHVCECCPKKPKKFDNEDELRAHESEKQYGCLYCSNRFKNKNEAERHQNSLHLRRHSWSCAALLAPEAAFHRSPTVATVDVCGYCGQEFRNQPRPDWDARTEHLNHAHKFGECNLAKKFFRADHFRQHLKHSHAGASGKWTNMLENACMKDEPPPEKQSASSGPITASLGQPAPPSLMVTTSGLSGEGQDREGEAPALQS